MLTLSILKESGYNEALLGMSLSYYDGASSIEEWWTEEKITRAARRLESLAFKGLGHSKALETIQVWFLLTATRAFWQEFDTYRVGITKNSASTMHTISKRELTIDDFDSYTSLDAIDNLNKVIKENPKDINRIKANIPEGFLQSRVVSTNYKVLQNIIAQRAGHRYKYWDSFITQLLRGTEHPELLIEGT